MNKSITEARVMKAIEEEMFGTTSPGFCLACGTTHSAEPDAVGLKCDKCGAHRVMGAENVMIMCEKHWKEAT